MVQWWAIYVLRHDAIGVPLKGVVLLRAVGTVATDDEVQTVLHGLFQTQIRTETTTHLQTQKVNREGERMFWLAVCQERYRVKECRQIE